MRGDKTQNPYPVNQGKDKNFCQEENMKMKRWLSIVLALILFLTCTPFAGHTKVKAATASPVTVKYFFSAGDHMSTVSRLIDAFNKGEGKEKGVYIELISEIEDPTGVMDSMVLSGNYPDIFTAQSVNLERYGKGYYKNLYDVNDPEVMALVSAAQPYVDDSFGTFGVPQDNFLCTLPLEVFPIKMVINLDLFGEAGLSEPKTWDDVLDAAEKITALGKEGTKGFGWTTWSAVWRRLTFKATLPSARKGWWDPNTATYDWSQYRPVIEAICTMYQNGWILGADDLGIDPIRSEFSAGHVGMFISPSYDYLVYKNQFPAQCNWKFIDMPVFKTGNKCRGAYFSRGGDAIFARAYDSASQAKKDAIEIAYAFLEGDAFVKALAESGDLIPFPGRFANLDYSHLDEHYAQIADVSGYAPVPVYPDSIVTAYLEGSNYANVFTQVMHGSYEGGLDQALKDLSATYNAAYAAAKADPYGSTGFSAYEYDYTIADSSLKPRITTQPKDQTVAAGDTAAFTIKSSNASSYQWYYRKSESSAWTAVSSSSGKTNQYSLTVESRHDGYQYRCKVTNSYGSVFSAWAQLSVITTKPVITIQPKNQTLVPGDNAVFAVKATGASAYQWYYRTSSTASWSAVSASAGKTANYTFETKEKHDGYQYRCKLTNAIGSIYTAIRTLTLVTDAPSITTQPADKSVTAGDKVVFTVKASGIALNYQWYYRAPDTGSWTKLTASSAKTASYSLTTQERHNGYQYRCQVSNLAGRLYTNICTLKVLPVKPSVTSQPGNQTVALGDTAVFQVKATGATSYQWYYRTSASGTWTKVSAESGKTERYSFATATRHDGYQYRCKLTNSVGSVYTSACTLTVVSAAPSITQQPSDKKADEKEKITFTLKASGKGLNYQWYYRTSASGTWTKISAASGATTSYSLTVLARHNGYQYRCEVKNVLGSVYSKIVKLTVSSASGQYVPIGEMSE